MSIQHLLEDFGGAGASPRGGEFQDDEEIESRRLAAFEEGYQAGWDDAAQAHVNDKMRLTSDLSQNLLDLSFTYNEAYGHLFKGLRPLFTEIVEKLLPEIMHATIGMRIVEELQRLAADRFSGEAEVNVAPSNLETVESVIDRDVAMPVTLVANPDLAEGQAQISLRDKEVEINLGEVISEIGAALDAFNHELQKEVQYGRKQSL